MKSKKKSNNYILILLALCVIFLAVVVIVQEFQTQKQIIHAPTATPDGTQTHTYTTIPATLPATASPTVPATNTVPPTATPTNTPAPTDTPTPSVDGIDMNLLEGLDATVQSWWYGYKDSKTGKLIYEIPAAKRRQIEDYGGIYKKNDDKKVVYLTFDEGYENGYTSQILDVLKEKNIKAIFFVTGDYLRDSPEMVKRIVEEGHLVGNHTDKHPIMPNLSVDAFVNELRKTEKLYEQIIGKGSRMYYYRPPEGSYSERDLCIAEQLGYKLVFWSFAYLDYDINNQPEYDAAYATITDSLHNGEVFLLHAVSRTNANILGDVIDYILQQGYEIRRIDE